MARLKGGKLLLDLSQFALTDDIEYPLSEEQINAILTKGLVVKIKTSQNILVVIDVIFNEFGTNYLNAVKCIHDFDNNVYTIQLNIQEKSIYVILED